MDHGRCYGGFAFLFGIMHFQQAEVDIRQLVIRVNIYQRVIFIRPLKTIALIGDIALVFGNRVVLCSGKGEI